MKKIKHMFFIGCLFFSALSGHSQTEVMAWGNITGIRVDGQLMDFETSLRVVGKNREYIHATGKEQQRRPSYERTGETQLVKTEINNIHFIQTVTDTGTGKVTIDLQVKADTTFYIEGVYFCVDLPHTYYKEIVKEENRSSDNYRIVLTGNSQALEIDINKSVIPFIRDEMDGFSTLYIPLMEKAVKAGDMFAATIQLSATGEIDHDPVEILLDIHSPGRLFQGLGGNFRLQNPRVDPQVIDYCLNNLRVSWGRVEMPWRNWHPDEEKDPLAEAYAGQLDSRVEAAMQMAQRLAAMGMPVIVSAWFPPEWAIDGDPAQYVRRGGVQAFRLDPQKEQKIYESLTGYLIYLKNQYGVEAVMYSFNESDLGIDVLHTAVEHAAFIKGLGEYMASRGLSTKLLLGDNSDATTFNFILPAMQDKETHKYIGAVSFHSWRGCDDETLHCWAGAARELNIPLLIGEGSTDASAHVYPQIFAESTFALYEINLYMRLCAICQPLSILQWQLTSDYSVLWGGGVYGSDGPLRPTQRFWNLKQLASTPENAFAMPFTCNKKEVNCAVFGNIARGEYAVHMVNNGASRIARIKGLPSVIEGLAVYVTNRETGMQNVKSILVVNGIAELELPPMSFVSLMNHL